MKLIKTTVDDATYKKLRRMMREEAVPSVSALFLKMCGVLTVEKEVAEIIRKARRLIEHLDTGEEFTLKSLFDKEDWENFDKSARLKAGKAFLAEMELHKDGVRVLGKTSANTQIYEKI